MFKLTLSNDVSYVGLCFLSRDQKEQQEIEILSTPTLQECPQNHFVQCMFLWAETPVDSYGETNVCRNIVSPSSGLKWRCLKEDIQGQRKDPFTSSCSSSDPIYIHPLSVISPEDGNSTLLRNIGIYPGVYTVSQRRTTSSSSQP
jgi:hypothetical protein